MTESLYEGVRGSGERAIGQQLGHEEAERRINEHRDTFITEADFKQIKEYGFDLVRLPVGYWLFEEAEGFVSGADHVQRAMDWAAQHDLKVLLDLHGAQGSQNGKDHSGQTGRVNFFKGDNREKTIGTIEHLATTYGNHPALWGLELLNEPRAFVRFKPLIDYYEQAYWAAAALLPPDKKIVVNDVVPAQSRRLERELGKRLLGDQLVLDLHPYRAHIPFGQYITPKRHLDVVNGAWRSRFADVSQRVPIIIGEWSQALPGSPTAETKKVFYDDQVSVYGKFALAHFYWSWKAPCLGDWSYRDQFKNVD